MGGKTTNSRIVYRGEVEKIEFAQRFMKKILRLLGANRHFLITYFYFLIIYCYEWVSRKARKGAKTRCFFATKALRHKVTRRFLIFFIPLSGNWGGHEFTNCLPRRREIKETSQSPNFLIPYFYFLIIYFFATKT